MYLNVWHGHVLNDLMFVQFDLRILYLSISCRDEPEFLNFNFYHYFVTSLLRQMFYYKLIGFIYLILELRKNCAAQSLTSSFFLLKFFASYKKLLLAIC